jgi:lipoprotein-anchoring transpeptidase ErfK/SrfK
VLPAVVAVTSRRVWPAATLQRSTDSARADGPGAAAPAAAPQAVKVSFTPASGARAASPDEPVVVQAEGGRLRAVVVTASTGEKLKGDLDAEQTTWTASERLAYGVRYTARVTAVDEQGSERVATSSFRTLVPATKLTTSISPLTGTEVGVGMPIVVKLSEPVSDRAAVERGLVVTSSRPVLGAWRWIDDEELHYRPSTYWPVNTDVRLDVRLVGVRAGKGLWGGKDRTVRFRVGSSTISTVDVRKLRMTVVRDGRVVRTIPVTTGKKGWLTRGGIKVVSEKYRMKVMDAATMNISPDDPEYYRLDVPYALRVTWSGEFVHGAPWSVSNQGRANVSHGCVGMSMADAAWFFGVSKIGDVINVVGSPRRLEPNNGWTDWNVSWQEWRAGSALGS